MIGRRMLLVASRLNAATTTAPSLPRRRREPPAPEEGAARESRERRPAPSPPPFSPSSASSATSPLLADERDVEIDVSPSDEPAPAPAAAVDRRAAMARRKSDNPELIRALSLRAHLRRCRSEEGDAYRVKTELINALSHRNLKVKSIGVEEMATLEEMDDEDSGVGDDEKRPCGGAVISRAWPRVSTKWMLIVSFVAYIGLGWLVYCLSPGNRLSVIDGYFESITIGYSVGLAPRDPYYQPNPWFSTWHILSGAILIAFLLTNIGENVEEEASMTMFEALRRREDYERKMRKENPPIERLKAFVQYNAAYLITIVVWIAWMGSIVAWSIVATSKLDDATQRWGFPEAQYFAVSVCSSAGSLGLPPNAPEWAYLLAGISMMVGVPLMALAVSCVVIMIWQHQRYRKVHDAAWEPVTGIEMEALRLLELIGDGDAGMTRGGFVLLGLLRMGQDGGIIGYLSDAYDEMNKREGGGEGLRGVRGG